MNRSDCVVKLSWLPWKDSAIVMESAQVNGRVWADEPAFRRCRRCRRHVALSFLLKRTLSITHVHHLLIRRQRRRSRPCFFQRGELDCTLFVCSSHTPCNIGARSDLCWALPWRSTVGRSRWRVRWPGELLAMQEQVHSPVMLSPVSFQRVI